MNCFVKIDHRNWNILVGDPEYKTNFFLKFFNEYTFNRFSTHNISRYSFLLNSWVIIVCLLLTYLYFLNFAYNILFLLLGYVVLIASRILFHNSCLIMRGGLFFGEHLIQLALRKYFDSATYFVLFNIPTFISGILILILDILLLHEWQKHIMSSFLHVLINIIWDGFSITGFFTILIVIVMTAITFGFVERVLKENWVLYDSFKKSSMIFMGIADALPFGVFLVDKNGKINYKNTEASEIYGNFCKISKNKNAIIYDMVHPNYRDKVKKDFEITIKSKDSLNYIAPIKTSKEEEMHHKIPKKSNSPLISEYQRLRSEGKISLLILGYDFYMISIKRHYYKSHNMLIVACQKMTEHKENDELMLQQQIETNYRAENLCRIFEILTHNRYSRGYN